MGAFIGVLPDPWQTKIRTFKGYELSVRNGRKDEEEEIKIPRVSAAQVEIGMLRKEIQQLKFNQKKRKPPQHKGGCYTCRRQGHLAIDCWSRESKCYNCGQAGLF
jgi:hypothetical protein